MWLVQYFEKRVFGVLIGLFTIRRTLNSNENHVLLNVFFLFSLFVIIRENIENEHVIH